MYGDPFPYWPLAQKPKKWTTGGSFDAPRDGSADRHHPAVDLGAPKDTDVLATEDQILTYTQGWDGPGTSAVFGYSPITNTTIVYGAIKPGSNLPIGTQVKKGQKIAEVGVYPKGSTMLHIEQWKGKLTPSVRTKNTWKGNTPQPELLINITPYLQRAMGDQALPNSSLPGNSQENNSKSNPTTRNYIGPLAIVGLAGVAYFAFTSR